MKKIDMDRFAIAAALREIAQILMWKGDNPFRARAYERAAKSVEAVADLDVLVESGRLTEIPGIGESLAAMISEFFTIGRSSLYEKLRAEVPPAFIELSQVPH